MTFFARHFILDGWQGPEYPSGLLKLFYPGFKRDEQEGWYMSNGIIVFIPNYEFFPYSEVIHGSAKLSYPRLTKVKEKWSTVKVDAFGFFFLACAVFYMHQTRGACACVCTCNCTHQMERTGHTIHE